MIKEIENQNGGYTVSDKGVVYSVKSNKVLSPSVSSGYQRLSLSHKGVVISESVHRLVASAFVDNPNNYRCVNHIDGNKLNNSSSNLEWCSHSQNIKHAIDTGLIKYDSEWYEKTSKAVAKANSRSVVNKVTGEVFPSIAELSRQTKVAVKTWSSRILQGRGDWTYLNR